MIEKSINKSIHSLNEALIKAAKKDKGFVTQYAKTTPYEDLAESFLMWLALRYDRVEDSDKETILKLIPNRIQYFDEQQFDMYPLYIKTKSQEICGITGITSRNLWYNGYHI